MADRLRVLVVQAFAEQNGGAERWLLHLLDATDALDVEVLLLKDGPFRQELQERFPVELCPVGRQPWQLTPAALRLRSRLRSELFDVVLGNTVKAQLVAAPVARSARVPSVWAKHDHSYDRTLARVLGGLSTRVVAGAQEVAAPTGRRDAVIVPPPRPERPPAPRAAARAHLCGLGIPLDDDVPAVLMAGRLVPFKGVEDAIRALVLPESGAWKLVVAGVDDHAAPGETARLRRLAASAGVATRVHFAGHVDGVSHWMAGFDALAVLTRRGGRREPAGEGFGGTAFEAMLAGVPVIAVEGGAVVRRLAGRAGVAVPPGRPDAVAAALQRLADPEVRARAGAAGRELVAGHPDARTCARLLVGVLQDAAATRR